MAGDATICDFAQNTSAAQSNPWRPLFLSLAKNSLGKIARNLSGTRLPNVAHRMP